MAGYLACVTSTGVPLFLRSHGDVPQLSFPIIGSLNGAQWFTSNAKASLLSCVSKDVKIVWRNFQDCLNLILVSSNDSPVESHCIYLLDLIFSAMVLIVGIQDLLIIDNVETLKKELKCCYPLIDVLFDQQSNSTSALISPLTRGVEVMYTTEHRPLLKYLESMTEQMHSGYGCLSVEGRILLATENWWHLHPQEIIVLSLFVSHLPPFQCVDIPVFLPKASSSMAHRLLVFQLVDGVQVMVLCDSEPSLNEAQEIVRTVWKPVKEKLTGLCALVPRCLPLTMTFDSSILALCLVNTVSHQTLFSLFAPSEDHQENTATLLSKGYQGSLSIEQRQQYLVQFYKTTVDNLIPFEDEESSGRQSNNEMGETSNCVRTRVPHKITETYVNAEDFKAYAVHRNPYNLFVLFHSKTPTYALRKMSTDVLEYLLDCHVL